MGGRRRWPFYPTASAYCSFRSPWVYRWVGWTDARSSNSVTRLCAGDILKIQWTYRRETAPPESPSRKVSVAPLVFFAGVFIGGVYVWWGGVPARVLMVPSMTATSQRPGDCSVSQKFEINGPVRDSEVYVMLAFAVAE